jgi:hypothetical protein
MVNGGGNWERSDRELRGSDAKPAACSIGRGAINYDGVVVARKSRVCLERRAEQEPKKRAQ